MMSLVLEQPTPSPSGPQEEKEAQRATHAMHPTHTPTHRPTHTHTLNILTADPLPLYAKPRPLVTPTFTLQPLPEEAFEQLLAVLADGGSGVRVDQERVRNFDLRQQQLVELDGATDVGLGAGAPLPPGEVI